MRTLPLLLALFATTLAAQERRLPLDPLTDGEREIAVGVARGNPRVRELVTGRRSRLIYAELVAVKDEKSGEPRGRFADVVFYRYEDDAGLRVLVDIEQRRVADVAAVSGRSVPVTAEEVEEAARLALASPAVARLFGEQLRTFRFSARPPTRDELDQPRIEALRTLGGSQGDPCLRNRCVVLFFRTGNRYVHVNEVLVDLTTSSVIVRRRAGGQP